MVAMSPPSSARPGVEGGASSLDGGCFSSWRVAGVVEKENVGIQDGVILMFLERKRRPKGMGEANSRGGIEMLEGMLVMGG